MMNKRDRTLYVCGMAVGYKKALDGIVELSAKSEVSIEKTFLYMRSRLDEMINTILQTGGTESRVVYKNYVEGLGSEEVN